MQPTPRPAAARPACRHGFTLIELLVTVAILAMLLAIMLPALGGAKESAVRARCMAHLRQCGMALINYATEHANGLPPAVHDPAFAASTFKLDYSGSNWDLRAYVDDYVTDFQAWKCPALGDVATIDSDANTRFASYGTFAYLPGRQTPDYDDGLNHPANLTGAYAPASTPMMQDIYEDSVGSNLRYNHGNGRALSLGGNPSFRAIEGLDGYGANINYFDGHVQWVGGDELVDVGRIVLGLNLRFYSTQLPIR